MGELRASIRSEHAVHLCLDMQRLFGPGGPWFTPWMERVVPAVARLAGHVPARTIFTRFVPPARADEAQGVWRHYYRKWECVTRDRIDPGLLDILPALQGFVPPGSVLDKPAYSAFSNPQLHPLLRSSHVDTLVISGAETDVCVLSTVLSAVDLGYRVIVAKDALCSSADQTHDALLLLYAKRFDLQIELAESEHIIAEWSS
jgi:nicotinamidase-related amidase